MINTVIHLRVYETEGESGCELCLVQHQSSSGTRRSGAVLRQARQKHGTKTWTPPAIHEVTCLLGATVQSVTKRTVVKKDSLVNSVQMCAMSF